MLSGPVALFSFIFWRRVRTPFLETVRLFSNLEFSSKSGAGKVKSQGLEKTLENWVLNRSAFSLGLKMVLFLSTRSGMPVFSLLWLLT